LLSRAERRSLKIRWRRERGRATPSPSALSGWLERFHDKASPKAAAGTAFIPAVTAELRGLWRVNQALLEFVQKHQAAASATLDMDATLIQTHKRDALFCYIYKHFKAYQPLNCWWAEQGAMLYSEFRDGNVPAGHEQLRVLKESLRHLPDSVKKVSLRSDTAAAVLRRGEKPALWRHRFCDRRRRDRGFSCRRAGDAARGVEAADPLGGRPAAANRSGMGRTQPQAGRLPLSGDP